MTELPSPSQPFSSRADTLLAYLDYFRTVVVAKVSGLTDEDLRGSRLPSGWAPLELVKHLTFVELRWLEWGFEGRAVPDPWGDHRDGRWYVGPDEDVDGLLAMLRAQGDRTRAVVESHELAEPGRPGARWEGAEPATLERVLFHLLQEYARHVGHLDVVREFVDGRVGEDP